jgi:hypothetical protein
MWFGVILRTYIKKACIHKKLDWMFKIISFLGSILYISGGGGKTL